VERTIVRFTAKGNYEIQAEIPKVSKVILIDEKGMELLTALCRCNEQLKD